MSEMDELREDVRRLRADLDATWQELTDLKTALADETARRRVLTSRFDSREIEWVK